MDLIIYFLASALIGVILFELYSRIYAKGNKKRLLYGISIGGVTLLAFLMYVFLK